MFKSKNQVDAGLTEALSRADEVLAERDKIKATICKTSQEVKATQSELEHALERLATEEAGLALAEDAADERETPAQRSVQSLRLRLEAQQARLRGLDRKLIEQEDALLNGRDRLIAAREVWGSARVAEFTAEYRRAVEVILGVLRRGIAVADSLGDSGLSGALRQAKLYDPANLLCSLIDLEPTRLHPGTDVREHYAPWEDDPAAVAVYNQLAGPRLAFEKLNTVANQIRQRRDEAAREEQRARFESTPRPKTTGYQVHYPPEYSPVAPVERREAGRG